MSTPARIRPKRIPDFVDLVSSEDEGACTESPGEPSCLTVAPAGPFRLPLAPKRAIVTPRKNAKATPSIKKAVIPTVKAVKPIIVVSDDEEDKGGRDVKPVLPNKSTTPAKTSRAKTQACEEANVKQEVAHNDNHALLGATAARVRSTDVQLVKQTIL